MSHKKKYITFLVWYEGNREGYIVRAINSTQARSIVWREEEKMGDFKKYSCRFATREELDAFEEGYADYCESIDRSIIV